MYDTGYNKDKDAKQIGIKITVICPVCAFINTHEYIGNISFKEGGFYVCPVCDEKIEFGLSGSIDP